MCANIVKLNRHSRIEKLHGISTSKIAYNQSLVTRLHTNKVTMRSLSHTMYFNTSTPDNNTVRLKNAIARQ